MEHNAISQKIVITQRAMEDKYQKHFSKIESVTIEKHIENKQLDHWIGITNAVTMDYGTILSKNGAYTMRQD